MAVAAGVSTVQGGFSPSFQESAAAGASFEQEEGETAEQPSAHHSQRSQSPSSPSSLVVSEMRKEVSDLHVERRRLKREIRAAAEEASRTADALSDRDAKLAAAGGVQAALERQLAAAQQSKVDFESRAGSMQVSD